MRCATLVHCAAWAAVGLLTAPTVVAAPFTYQGLLKDSGGGAATYDFQVSIFTAATDDAVFAGPFVFEDVAVDEGRFTLVIDPGATVFDGAERWLAIRVRRGDQNGSYAGLTPRQRVRATPYAQHADDADFAAQVAPNSVTALELADASVGSLELADGAVGTDQLSVRAVTETKLATGAVNSTAIADGTIASPDLADDAVTRAKLLDAAVATAELADASVSTAKLQDSAVTSAKLEDGSVTSAKMAPFSVGSLQIDPTQVQRRVGGAAGSCATSAAIREINEDGSVSCEAIPNAASLWSLNGNAGTTPSTQFLGTTDAQAFEIRTHGRRHLRIEPSVLLSGGAPVTANVIGGSHANLVSSGVRGASIGGGGTPMFYTDPDVFTGDPNAVVSHYGTVAGGVDNIAGGNVSFGVGNAYFATVSGGRSNAAAGHSSTVSGGSNNFAYGDTSSVSGGTSNTAWVGSSVVAGGSNNCAGAHGSFAAGTNARVRPDSDPGTGGACGGLASYANNGIGDQGTFVWADAAGPAFLSTGSHRFEVRATGGVRFVTGISAIGVPDAGVKLDADDNAWEVLSDRDAKAGIQAVPTQDVLARLLALPIYTWHYQSQGPTTQHMGPMAQDFHAAFGLNGDDDRHISTLDPDGVALAAIQGVYAHFDALRDADAIRIAALESDNVALRAALDGLARRVRALEADE